MIWLLLTVLAFVFSEVFGYVIHRIIHSESYPKLTKRHMEHHMRDYGPRMNQRKGHYIQSNKNRWNILGVGIEWFLLIWLGLGCVLALGLVTGWSLHYIGYFLLISFVYSWFVFSYMHDAMHTEGFWMLYSRMFRGWFLRVRRLHDLHHTQLADTGRMYLNFGICFFFVDKWLGTLRKNPKPVNFIGLRVVNKKYKDIIKSRKNN